MTREKSHDEIFCRSCGNPIKKRAEICPECGVKNEQAEAQNTVVSPDQNKNHGGRQPTSQQTNINSENKPHDPSQYSTSVSENWHYGVGASVILWLIGLIPPEGSAIAGFFFLIAWALMPISIYYDRQWVQSTTNWQPNLKLWIPLSLFPLVNIVAGGIYLVRRYQNDQISSASRNNRSAGFQGREQDSALDSLRDRYASGELSDEEFEQKVEQIVGTEDAETAKVHMNQKDSSKDTGNN